MNMGGWEIWSKRSEHELREIENKLSKMLRTDLKRSKTDHTIEFGVGSCCLVDLCMIYVTSGAKARAIDSMGFCSSGHIYMPWEIKSLEVVFNIWRSEVTGPLGCGQRGAEGGVDARCLIPRQTFQIPLPSFHFVRVEARFNPASLSASNVQKSAVCSKVGKSAYPACKSQLRHAG
jgi:hypothetical protein